MSTLDEISLCSISIGDRRFGIETGIVLEVLGQSVVRRVPLAPPWIAGIIAYRGEVLTTFSLRALLGMPSTPSAACVVVLEDPGTPEPWGLVVDAAHGVVLAIPELHERSGSDPGSETYRTSSGLLTRLDPARLDPGRHGESNDRNRVDEEKGAACAH